uniref:HTH psq-type domain-containing protein n=1 Tax=Ditylenchus dipsaci TaxID=166011 RepID=A0A915EHM0_9BILA
MDDIDEASVVDLSEVDEARSPKKRKAYSIEFKLKVIKYAKDSKSKNSASKKFGIDWSTVNDWVKSEDKLKLQSTKQFTLALVPPAAIEKAFEYLTDMSIPEHLPFSNLVGLDVFINYVRENWVGKRLCNGDWKYGRYNSELWNHGGIDVPGSAISTCQVENWHRLLNMSIVSKNKVVRLETLTQQKKEPTRSRKAQQEALKAQLRAFDLTKIPKSLTLVTRAALEAQPDPREGEEDLQEEKSDQAQRKEKSPSSMKLTMEKNPIFIRNRVR